MNQTKGLIFLYGELMQESNFEMKEQSLEASPHPVTLTVFVLEHWQ